jgi:hypothetical protein
MPKTGVGVLNARRRHGLLHPHAPGFPELFVFALASFDVLNDCGEHLFGMVAEFGSRDVRARRNKCSRKLLELANDFVVMFSDELAECHRAPVRNGRELPAMSS